MLRRSTSSLAFAASSSLMNKREKNNKDAPTTMTKTPKTEALAVKSCGKSKSKCVREDTEAEQNSAMMKVKKLRAEGPAVKCFESQAVDSTASVVREDTETEQQKSATLSVGASEEVFDSTAQLVDQIKTLENNLLRERTRGAKLVAALEAMQRRLAFSRKCLTIAKKDSEGYAALHQEAMNDEANDIKILVDAGVDVNEKPFDAIAPLRAAACIDAVAKIHAALWDGTTPLHTTVSRGSTSGAKELIAGGIDVNLLNAKGETPLYVAATKREIEFEARTELLRMLIAAGAKPIKLSVNERNRLERSQLQLLQDKGMLL